MQSIFYHSFTGESLFEGRLKVRDIQRAVTLHPIKTPSRLYRLHSYFLSQHSQDLRHQTNLLHQQLLESATHLQQEPSTSEGPLFLGNTSILGLKPGLGKNYPERREDMFVWDFLSKSVFSLNYWNPKRHQEAYLQQALNDTVLEIMEMVNKFSKQRGRVIEFQSILYGYVRLNPLYGVDYILDLLLTYKKYRGKKMTVPVRRHAYLQQAFSQPEIREIFSDDNMIGLPLPPQPHDEKLHKREARHAKGLQTEINFILPLSGRVSTFRRFLKNFEQICLQTNENANLAVVLVGDDATKESMMIKAIFEETRIRYPHNFLRLVETSGQFSRAMALEIGANLFPNHALLFFIDVDIVMDGSVLERVRLNTISGRQAYFPIVFSEYDPRFSEYVPEPDPTRLGTFSDARGYWRQFGYGIVSLYRSDMKAVGGMDTSIEGWGKEDVDLFGKVVRSNLTAFRAPDPGLVHIFHPINCSPQLESLQYNMCWGSKLSSLASVHSMARKILQDPDRYLD